MSEEALAKLNNFVISGKLEICLKEIQNKRLLSILNDPPEKVNDAREIEEFFGKHKYKRCLYPESWFEKHAIKATNVHQSETSSYSSRDTQSVPVPDNRVELDLPQIQPLSISVKKMAMYNISSSPSK
jgi:hypothetical protein